LLIRQDGALFSLLEGLKIRSDKGAIGYRGGEKKMTHRDYVRLAEAFKASEPEFADTPE
jgi:hypothetical protein